MPNDTREPDRIGPELTLEEYVMPPAVAQGIGTLLGTEPPETGADWVESMREALTVAEGRAPTVDDLCTTADGLHAFDGETVSQEYVCVLDPLMVPFLTGEFGTIRSKTPARGTEIEMTIDENDLSLSHADAVVSIGVSDDVSATTDVSTEAVYRQVCEYVHVFEDEREYETWAADVDAETASLPAPTGVAIARELSASLFESPS